MPVAACDFSTHRYTYADAPAGDLTLANFSIDMDKAGGETNKLPFIRRVVALARSAAVVGAIGRIGRREAAQSAGRQQVLLHQGQDLRRALALHQGKGQREGEELVGADRGIGAAGSG